MGVDNRCHTSYVLHDTFLERKFLKDRIFSSEDQSRCERTKKIYDFLKSTTFYFFGSSGNSYIVIIAFEAFVIF